MFEISKAMEILERTPNVLEQLLNGLSDSWIYTSEGDNSWSPFDIVGHLIHGEKTDWIDRTKLILEKSDRPFEPFDRYAQFKNSKDKNITQLLREFKNLRVANLEILKGMRINKDDLKRKGIHPDFGEVTLGELLSTWVVHDLGHIRQIVRVMAKQYGNDVGQWKKYLPVLNE